VSSKKKNKGRKKPLINSDKIHYITDVKYLKRSVRRQEIKYKLTEKQTEKLLIKGVVKKRGFKIEVKLETIETVAKKLGLTENQLFEMKNIANEYFKFETDKSKYEKFVIKYLKNLNKEIVNGYTESIEFKNLRRNFEGKDFTFIEKDKDNKSISFLKLDQFLLHVTLWHANFGTRTFYIYLYFRIFAKQKQAYYSITDQLVKASKLPKPEGEFRDLFGNFCAFDTTPLTTFLKN
jgi:hypothetical protein